jgi:very-short-patch-repair endonuclease
MERELLENLIEKNLSTREISKETGKSQATVRHWLKKFDLKTNPNPSFEKVKTWICKSCKEEFTLSIHEFGNHTRWCEKNPLRDGYSNNLVHARSCIENHSNQFLAGKATSHSPETLEKLKRIGASPEHRAKISKGVRDFFDKNPEKVGWRHHGHWRKKASWPELFFKRIFETQGLNFIHEHPVKRFSIDFAFPEKMIAVEIDGAQHSQPKEKERDKRKDDELLAEGWKTIRVYWPVFNDLSKEEQRSFVDELLKKIS